MRKKMGGEASLLPPVLPTLRHISARKTASVTGKKTLTHQVVVMIINHRDRQPSGPRLQGTFPQKTASVPVSDSQTSSCLLMVFM